MKAFLLALSLLAAVDAHADACPATARPDGPLATTYLRGDLGTGRRACPRTDVMGGLGFRIIYEPQNFYGNVVAHARVDGAWAVLPDLELFGAMEAVQFQTVISSFSAQRIGPGHTSLGATWKFYEDPHIAVSGFGRGTLPTAFGLYQHQWPFGIDAGVTGQFVPARPIVLHGAAFGVGSISMGPGDPLPRAGLAGHLGMDLAPWDFVAVTTELDAQTLYGAELDHLSLGVGVRAAPWAGLSFELGALFPVAGRERNFTSLVLRGGWTFL